MKKMNILVTGSNGQLGSELRELSADYPDFNFLFTSKEDLDISDKHAVKQIVEVNDISCIINCAAYTAVDKAETEPGLADKINNQAVKILAEIAKEKEVSLIHISTDYVFDGHACKPYSVNHPTQPINKYGETKLYGEKAMKEINPKDSMIIRTSWVYSSYGNNFVKTMLRLGQDKQELNVISDQIGVPTYARDLAEFILRYAVKAEHQEVKTYHFTNEGVCSWFDFAREIMNLSGLDCKVKPIPTSAYPTPAKRPYYSLLDKTSLKTDFGVEIPYWKESLRECLQILNK